MTDGPCLGVRKCPEAHQQICFQPCLTRAFYVPESPVLSASNSSFIFMTEQLFGAVTVMRTLPVSSPNLGGAVELGRTASGLASGLGERLSRGRSGVRIGKWASRGGGDERVGACYKIIVCKSGETSTSCLSIDNHFTLLNDHLPTFVYQHLTHSRADPWGAVLAMPSNASHNSKSCSARCSASRCIPRIS